MKKDDLKKILAGLSITGLLSGAGITASAPHAFGGSGWSSKKSGADSTGKTEKKSQEQMGQSGWSVGKSGAGSVEKSDEGKQETEGKEKGKAEKQSESK